MTNAGAAPENGARWARWAALFCVLLIEFEVITLSVEGVYVAAARGGSWAKLGDFEAFGRIALLFVVVLVVLGRPSHTLVTRLRPTLERALLAGHAALFASFWLVTRAMLGQAEAPRGPALLWITGWALVGAGSGVLLWLGLLGVPRLRARDVLAALAACFALGWLMSRVAWWTQGIWRPVSGAELHLAAALLGLVSSHVTIDAPELVLGLDDFAVRVESACSGLEGICAITVLGAAYLLIFRKELRFPHAFALLALGIAASWLANGVRLAAMVWLGAHVSPELALGGFHSKAGWVFFSCIALGMAFAGHNARFFARPRAQRETADPAEVEPTAAFLTPLLALLAAALGLGMFGLAEGPWYALRMLFGLAALLLFRHQYGDLRWPGPGAARAGLLGVLLGLLWLGSALLFPSTDAPDAAPVSFGWLLLRAIGFSTIVPLAEELAFRGYLLRVLQRRDFASLSYRAGAWWAVGISSLVFGVLHDRWIAGTLAGLAYALIQIRNGRLRDAVLAHAATNAVLATVVVATHNPNLFG